jgi:HTH-type transcriptional regulator/antitoxin HigA
MATMLDFTRPHVLRDEAEYETAVAEIDALLDADPVPGTSEADRLEFLAVLVEAYEDMHVPQLPTASPQEVVDFVLDQEGRDRNSLAPLMAGRNRVSEFFNGVRALSINQVRALREELGIPADLLIT